MSMNFKYNFILKRGEIKKIELPNLKYSGLLLRKFSIISDQKAFDIKLNGKETIFSYGEAVFYHNNCFDLSDQIAQIIDSDTLTMTIKNLCTGKDNNTVNLAVTLNYLRTEGNIIYNNTYTNLNPEGLANILEDIRKAGKHISKIIFTSPNKLSSMELKPQFEADPKWLDPHKILVNGLNQIVLDLSKDEYDPDMMNQLKYYTLSFSDNIDKLGVIVYGYVN